MISELILNETLLNKSLVTKKIICPSALDWASHTTGRKEEFIIGSAK